MKLIRLKILDDFRGLNSKFEINFRNDELNEDLSNFHPFCLAGLNGSGKSNVLEALANIFYHLECCTNGYPEYAFSPKESTPNAYQLEYFIINDTSSRKVEDLIKVKISKKKDSIPKMSIDGEKFKIISETFGSSFLPDLVVAYSSGENETLSLPFVKMKLFQYDEYLKDFIGNKIYEKPKSSLLHINYEMSQAVLLTILLFFDDAIKPLQKELGIENIQQFTINLNNNWQEIIIRQNSSSLDKFSNIVQARTINESEYEKDDKKVIIRILEHLSEQIKKLKDSATCSYLTDDYMSLDFWVDKNTKETIRNKFDNDPYKFFSVFQMLQALNERVEELDEKNEIYNSKGYYTDYKRSEHNWFFYFTDYFITQKNEDSNIEKKLLLKQLSDGEQQFLHTLGICLMLQKKRTLLLLDEPETHFNPDWRSKFINILRKTLEAGGDNFLLKDIILTSHSPFIISDCLPDKVIQFRKSINGVEAISADNLKFKTFGAGVDYILQRFFGVNSLVSEYSREWIKNVIENGTDNELREAIDFVGESDVKQFLFSELYKRNKNANS